MGIKKIALVTGYNSRYLDKLKLKCFHNRKWSTTNMVFSLCKADSWLKKYECIVSYGDILYEKKALKGLINNRNKSIWRICSKQGLCKKYFNQFEFQSI